MNPFLSDPSLAPLWPAVTAALDRNGIRWRGRLSLPQLTAEGRRRLAVLIERRIPADRRTVPLSDLDAGIQRLTDGDLPAVLAALGYPPSGRREVSIARRAATEERRNALAAAVEEILGDAAWTTEWRDAAWSDGLFARRTPVEVCAMVAGVGRVLSLDCDGRSRSEVAANLFGDAHALDTSMRLTALVTRALTARDGVDDERAVWERTGIPLDLVSAPVLSWGLPVLGEAGAAPAVRAMTAAGLPLHLSTLALRAAPLTVSPATPVLVVENPRLVEAAAQRRLPASVLCANGSPTTAPILAIIQLRAAGAHLRYHGDFDAPGLAITGRAQAMGCTPFKMAHDDYLAAVDAAEREGVDLPQERAPARPTPWDPALAVAFNDRRAIVHEERVMDDLLAAHAVGS